METGVLAQIADPRLRAYVVWVPKVGAQESNVPEATRLVPDRRARHYWDGAGILLRSSKGSPRRLRRRWRGSPFRA